MYAYLLLYEWVYESEIILIIHDAEIKYVTVDPSSIEILHHRNKHNIDKDSKTKYDESYINKLQRYKHYCKKSSSKLFVCAYIYVYILIEIDM